MMTVSFSRPCQVWVVQLCTVPCRFREIVGKLKSMAQALRPPPKRRPSQGQIGTQASATSSQPSSRAPSSQPNTPQLPNINECAALADAPPPLPSVSVPHAEASEESCVLGAAAAAAVAQTAKEGAAAASSPEAQRASEAPAATSAPQESDRTSVQVGNASMETDVAEQRPRPTSGEYVSPFEQAQAPVAASVAQAASPFANVS